MGLGYPLIFRAVRILLDTNSHSVISQCFVLFIVFGYLIFSFLSFYPSNACQVRWEGSLAVARATRRVY